MLKYKKIIVAGLAAFALVLAFYPQSLMTTDQARTLGLVLVTLSLWATALVPAYLASLIFIALALLFKLAPPDVVFSGFHSSAMWLVFSGFLIAAGVRKAGLSERIGSALTARLSHSFPLLIFGIFAVAIVLAFVMPSSLGRFFLLWPIVLALSDKLGFAKGTNGRAAVALATVFACHLPGFTLLPSNVPNLILAGAAQTIYGVDLTYAQYMALHFPILGLIKSVIIFTLIVRLFPDTPQPAAADDGEVGRAQPLGWRQWYVIAVLAITLAFWVTDTFHGINPAWIGICASIGLLMPGIGPVAPEDFDKHVNFGVFLFIAGFLAVGAVVNATGLGIVIAQGMEYVLPLSPGRDFINFLSLSLMGFVVGIISILPGVPAVLTPMASELSALTGLSLTAVLMTQVIGFSTILFPYQSAPLMVGMQVTEQPVGNMMKILFPLTLITAFILLPLDFFWWKLLGFI
ncbi:SLC13 family permease [Martelella radicis]|uniref:Di/tricarboxylate transporter n=1 Tax=Martelella radicis TaxID=1397476 RepID=A0A7W6PAI8_9HYPH|nr:SLC13 family permease [Martelella radicis]MBB4121467.1 di/tricarboxylate transporter [Martelella radicis]